MFSLFSLVDFSFISFILIFKKGYPPPLRNMLHMNGSNLAAATPDGIQSPQASSSNPVGSSLSQKKTCPYCGQQLSWHALSRHIRDMHKNKSNFVTCKFCNKMFRNKNSLGCHMWRFHKEAKEGAKDVKTEAKIDNDIKPSSVEVENPWFFFTVFLSCIFPFLESFLMKNSRKSRDIIKNSAFTFFVYFFLLPFSDHERFLCKIVAFRNIYLKSFFFFLQYFFHVQIAFFFI